MLECQAIHLWLFDGAQLRLMSSSGEDDTVQLRIIQEPGEGYVADMAEEGEPLLIADADDERLLLRNAALTESAATPPITNALVVPLMQEGAEIGVLEAVNKVGDTPFDDDDQFFLTAIGETVSSALKNASLMFAERKLEILETLVRVSSEITSTLRTRAATADHRQQPAKCVAVRALRYRARPSRTFAVEGGLGNDQPSVRRHSSRSAERTSALACDPGWRVASSPP